MEQMLTEKLNLSRTRSLLLGIWNHLNRRRRIQLGLVVLVMLACGLAELVSLGAVIPFLAVLSNPDLLWNQPLVQSLSLRLGLQSAKELLLPAILTFAAAAVLAALIRLINLWLNGRLAAAVGSDLSCEAYRRTLYQNYSEHIQRNSSVVISGVTTQITRTVAALMAFLQLVTATLVAIGLFAGLLLINWPAAIVAAAIFGGVYALLVVSTKSELQRNSQCIAQASSNQIKALQEGLGAIRDVLINGSQGTYVDVYRQADWSQRNLQARNQFIGAFPRYVVEAIGLVSIALLGGLLVYQQGSGIRVIPLLGAMALGAQRLLPALQQIYANWSNLKGYNADMAGVLSMLAYEANVPVLAPKPLGLRQSVVLKNVRFRYSPDQKDVLDGLTLEIHRGERVGLIGSTGRGKSTTVDLLMGLLQPTEGFVLVDGFDLNDPSHPERLAAWHAAIAHVPQNIYLADSSFAENIAFGVPRKNIDTARLRKAADIAQISGFIEATPHGYNSFVGERGIQLSGGQRQRIGLARALYRNSKLLVLDEATSALDIDTEKSVLDSIRLLSDDLTIVMIAHRLSSLAGCDRIISL